MSRTPAGSIHVRVVAIDGHGGAGKSTLAERVATALGGAPVGTRTTSQAGRSRSIGGRACSNRSYDPSPAGALPAISDTSSSRLAFRPYLSFAIWVDTPRDVCLARGLERDGDGMLWQWRRRMADEDRYVEREAPDRRADLVVDGAPMIEHDPDRDVIVLREGATLGPPRP